MSKDTELTLMSEGLNTKLSAVLSEDQVNLVKEAAGMYLSEKTQGTGKQFWKQFILSSTKDYSNDGMRYRQSVLELQGRLGGIFDETVQYEQAKLDLEELELDIQEIEDVLAGFRQTDSYDYKKKTIDKRRKEIDINSKKIKIESMRINIENRYKEIKDFKELADELKATGGQISHEEARFDDMNKKIVNRYVQHLLYNDEMSPSEKAFFMRDGLLVPPVEVEEKLKLLPPGPDVARALNTVLKQRGMYDALQKNLLNAPESATVLKLASNPPEADGAFESLFDGGDIQVVTAEQAKGDSNGN